jgi:hypothetical protein
VRLFHFLNLNSNFEFGPVGNRPEPEPVRTDRTGSLRFGKPWTGRLQRGQGMGDPRRVTWRQRAT